MKTEQLLPFYRFIYLRQSVWHNRFVSKKTFPWTEDTVLQQFKFCNVYRELDKGSQSIINFINRVDISLIDKLFNIIAYRFFNRVETIETLFRGGLSVDSFNAEHKQDLTPLTANDFLIVGPGAKWGLDILWQKKLTEKEADKACRALYENQTQAFNLLKEEGLDFDKIKWQNPDYCGQPYLALHDIQNSLCEFRKYHRLNSGEKAKKRLYTSEST